MQPLLAILIGFGTLLSHANETSAVRYASGEEMVEGYLVKPAGAGPFPAIIVIHEWWGLNEQVKEEAERLASEGYVALAVDLYRGRATSNPDEAHELSRGLPRDRAVRDLRAAFSYLASRADVRADRIGALGWCMGGGYSLELAMAEPRLAASIIYYGRLATDESLLAQIRAPVLGLFGEDDRGIPASSVRAFENSMKKLGKAAEVHIYPGAGHAFANQTRPSYREAAARDAWEKTRAFLRANLQN
ncbi:MAG: dienelactone hydrolase family protein [Acidobacteria bacterium]|nr:dienelactone hydrolase family protein [Acidobacteriota bacterium]